MDGDVDGAVDLLEGEIDVEVVVELVAIAGHSSVESY